MNINITTRPSDFFMSVPDKNHFTKEYLQHVEYVETYENIFSASRS